MKNKSIKIILILIVILNMIAINSNADTNFGLSSIIDKGKNFIDASNGETSGFSKKEIKGLSDSIYNILLFIAVVVSVIVITILGIKYIIGSVETKAEIKDTMVPFIVGCVVVFGSFGIWKIVVTILNGLSA